MTDPPLDEKGVALDRQLQRDLLLKMRAVYPRKILGYPEDRRPITTDVVVALQYLHEHGLCDSGLTIHRDGNFAWTGAKLTAKGIDFLEDDGGLSAILGVVTVKLHADTLRQLIEAKIDDAGISADEKSGLRRHLAKLPDVALQAGLAQLVRLGLANLPDAIQWLRTLGVP